MRLNTLNTDIINNIYDYVIFEAKNKDELQVAVDLWYEDKEKAINYYGHISLWNTSLITDMSNLFKDKYKEFNEFNDNINDWDVSNVINMEFMFKGVVFMSYFDTNYIHQKLNKWDVSSVTNMKGMFKETTRFDQHLNLWDVSNVRDMSEMFCGASFGGVQYSSESIFRWKVSPETNIHHMFYETWAITLHHENPFKPWSKNRLQEAVDLWYNNIIKALWEFNDISLWDTSLIEDMSKLFYGKYKFNSDISNWNVSKVINMDYMFAGAVRFNKPLNSWDVSNVESMNGMFHDAKLFNQPLNSWNVSSVKYMRTMFFEASSFNQPLNSWDVSSVIKMTGMFHGAESFDKPLGSWDVSSVNNMGGMFQGASSFNQNISQWNVHNVQYMIYMFLDAKSFNKSINTNTVIRDDGTTYEAWDVSSVTNMKEMFKNAIKFNQPLNSWDVSSVIDMTSMFENASSFNQNINSWEGFPHLYKSVLAGRDRLPYAKDFYKRIWRRSALLYKNGNRKSKFRVWSKVLTVQEITDLQNKGFIDLDVFIYTDEENPPENTDWYLLRTKCLAPEDFFWYNDATQEKIECPENPFPGWVVEFFNETFRMFERASSFDKSNASWYNFD